MHKIKKGIKKKIKGKKGKHEEDDLFDPEQLEKYRRELEEAKAAKAAAEGGESEDPTAAAGTSSSEGKEKKADDDEEWQKFKQLTSGIDQVLKKTSGDLDRIKTSSYFQRVPPKPDFIIPTSSTSAQSRKQAATSPPAKKGTRWIDLESGQQPSDSEDEGKAAKVTINSSDIHPLYELYECCDFKVKPTLATTVPAIAVASLPNLKINRPTNSAIWQQ